jgi:hypothetical protein
MLIIGVILGIALDQAFTRGWIKTAYELAIQKYKAWKA